MCDHLPPVYHKVYAFITRGTYLLTFTEAGTNWVQIPGGTLEADEEPRAGALREAEEETGLRGFEVVRFLGRNQQTLHQWGVIDQPNTLFVRWFYHLRYDHPTPDTWSHWELHASDGSGPHLFHFVWQDLRHTRPTIFAMRHAQDFWQTIERVARDIGAAH